MRYILTPPVHGGNAWWEIHDTEHPSGQPNVILATFRTDMPYAENFARRTEWLLNGNSVLDRMDAIHAETST